MVNRGTKISSCVFIALAVILLILVKQSYKKIILKQTQLRVSRSEIEIITVKFELWRLAHKLMF